MDIISSKTETLYGEINCPGDKSISQRAVILSGLLNGDLKVKNFHGLAIDSRLVKKDNLFLTIRGKNNDGVKFIHPELNKVSLQKPLHHSNW